ncbi:MAG: hypothetical protein DRP01_09450 [Archaeoglobales archaeon]|nr:MAG: hypothetical protein DRP01_09450 [Archaeoglobales archaeon]
MALVMKPLTITVSTVDGGLTVGRHILHLPVDTDPVAALNFATNYAAQINAITDAEVVSAVVGLPLYEDTYPSAPVTSDVEDKGVFLMLSAGDNKSALAIPGIDDAVLIPAGEPGGGIELDMDNAEVQVVVYALVDGLDVEDSQGATVTVAPCDSRGSDYVAVRTAYKQNRASHKRTIRRG